ncbi:MAG: hypothetical protein JW827_06005 [Spirochaetes bacterium]|nr:hypothetical protein [Spirochaetota bacterium]
MENNNKLYRFIKDKLFIVSGLNKQNEIARLIFEILKKYNYSLNEMLALKEIKDYRKDRIFDFNRIKKILINLRYPETSKQGQIRNNDIFLPPLHKSKFNRKYFYSGSFKPRKIYVEKKALSSPLSLKILSQFGHMKPVLIDRLKDIQRDHGSFLSTMGKDELFLVHQNYDIIKPCPCSKNVLSCGYYILNIGFGCPYDCSYCYLQHYSNFPGIILPVNINDILEKLGYYLKKSIIPMRRIGTGEFTDSLALDPVTGYTIPLLNFFESSDYILELKTKSTHIHELLNHRPLKNVVVAWSVNPQKVIDQEEWFTPSLDERLRAAESIQRAGYPVAFHFDPILYYPAWEKDYDSVIDKIFTYTRGHISWISLGTLRFHRSLKSIIELRFPQNKILDSELLIDPSDKKMRYPHFVRKSILSRMIRTLRSYNKHINIYLCMEPGKVWTELNIRLNKF